MGRFFTNLKRNKTYVELYIDGVLISTIKVSENNQGNKATIDFYSDDRVKFKIIKEDEPKFKNLVDDSFFNKEEFNK